MVKSKRTTASKAELTPPPDDALAQIEAMGIDTNASIRVRAIHNDRKDFPKEFEGTLADVDPRARKLNDKGYNIYLFAQPTRELPAESFAKDEDVIEVEVLFADGDETEIPKDIPKGGFPSNLTDKARRGYWHATPTFTLVHPKTKRWWAFWCVSGCSLDRLPEMQKRIAALYGSDRAVSNLSRVVRLAGYDRWKNGERFAPYNFHAGSGKVSKFHLHDGDLPEVAAERKQADDPKHINVIEDQKHNIEAFLNWLDNDARVTVKGGSSKEERGRNVLLAATAAMGHSYALTAETTHELLWDHFNPRLGPPLEEEEFETTCFSGFRSATSRQGNMTSDYWELRRAEREAKSRRLFEDRADGKEDVPEDDEPDALRVQSFAELLKKDFPPVVDIVSGRTSGRFGRHPQEPPDHAVWFQCASQCPRLR